VKREGRFLSDKLIFEEFNTIALFRKAVSLP
jgi:hypothetical protein